MIRNQQVRGSNPLTGFNFLEILYLSVADL